MVLRQHPLDSLSFSMKFEWLILRSFHLCADYLPMVRVKKKPRSHFFTSLSKMQLCQLSETAENTSNMSRHKL